ncbi:MAG: hypothetical protein EBR82_64380, partial [Caulobacteraceae bacterium]|nr:hypothetical protein [Caulobacteraceae bacterium]
CEAWASDRSEGMEPPQIEIGPYNIGDPWADEAKDADGNPYRFLTVDVQRNHFWAVVRAWARDGRSRLVDRAKLLTSHEIESMAKQHGVMFGRFFADHSNVVTCESRVFLDSKYNTSNVFRMCADHGFHAVNSQPRKNFKHHDGIWRIYDEGRFVDPMVGERSAYRKLVLNFHFSGDSAKDRLEVLRSQTGSDDLPMWTAAMDHGHEYARQMSAEAKVKVFKADGVTYSFRWKMLDKDNHYFDCEVMQILAASMAGLIGDDLMPSTNADEKSD